MQGLAQTIEIMRSRESRPWSSPKINHRIKDNINLKSPTKNKILRDFRAMQQVWLMLKTGTIRWCGEVGRRY